MAAVKFQKGSEEWQMFMDFWKLCQDYWKIEESESYWSDMIRDSSAFSEKYGSEFAKRLAIAFLETQDTEYRNQNK